MVDRKLGRGLDFFLSDGRAATPPNLAVGRVASGTIAGEAVPVTLPSGMIQANPRGPELKQVPVSDLVPNPKQPRRAIDPDQLQSLADSIRASGLLQPILARRIGEQLEIVAGERRWRAAQAAGLPAVPVIILTVTDEESGVFALVENLQREDLNAMEKAKAFRQLLDQLKTSQEELGSRVGLDRSSVSNFIRLLELAPEVQDHVSRGTLSMGHARALLAIKDSTSQVAMADECIRRSLSVRALEEMIRQSVEKSGSAARISAKSRADKKAAWIKEIEETLCDTLGTPTVVKYGQKSSMIQITCAGREEFERIFNRLKNC